MIAHAIRRISSLAPIRIADIGGWTDTWFARHGKVLNIGVSPFAEVDIDVFPAGKQPYRLFLEAENYGDSYELDHHAGQWQKHPLLEAAIEFMRVPEQFSARIGVRSNAPAGASTGTSAAVLVALIGALDRLRLGTMSQSEVAYAALHVEREILGNECGIQDQLCSAYGGIDFIEIDRFPSARVTAVHIPERLWEELNQRLVLIYLGKSHSSSGVHAKVIDELEQEGPQSPRLETLRRTAEKSRDALTAGDLNAFGRAMIENTDAQARLHSDLVCEDARRVIEIAQKHGATGWKVNGAGGEGGSLTILSASIPHAKNKMIEEIENEKKIFRHIPTLLSPHGLKVWEAEGLSP